MIRALRRGLAVRLSDVWSKQSRPVPNLCLKKLAWCIRFSAVKKRSDVSKAQIFIPFSYLRACELTDHLPSVEAFQPLVNEFKRDQLITNCSLSNDGLGFHVADHYLHEAVLSDILSGGSSYGQDSDLRCWKLSNGASCVTELETGKNIVVEFSAPNIAKPFHAGHLRSTILGQFVANISSWFGQNVVRLNYLGDWGTQFGLLAVGFEKYGNLNSLNADPIKHLFEVYVKINKDAEADPKVHDEGMNYFLRMERDGDEKALAFWQTCRQHSLGEYLAMYQRLGVSFTHIHSESMYYKEAAQLIKRMESAGLLLRDSKTGVGFVDLTADGDKEPFRANIVKSDGTSLYLTRDIVAAVDRRNTFNAHQLYYVVENGQHAHFRQLVGCLQKLGHDWTRPDMHVKFGRVEGMSTRRGQVVFLRDILDEARLRMLENMKSSTTTKVTSADDVESAAEALGVSAILIQDMKERRANNYKFSWERSMNFNGDTGVFLQYTHARLYSIVSSLSEQLSTVAPDYRLLTEAAAKRLVLHLARFDDVLLRSYVELEPCHLVHYLFTIGRLVNVAHSELFVKNQPDTVAKTRLVMFQSAMTVLANGLQVLGIRPLERL